MQGKYSVFISHQICQELEFRSHLFLACLLVHYFKVKLFFGDFFFVVILLLPFWKWSSCIILYVQYSQQGEILALPQTADSLNTFTTSISGALRKIFGGWEGMSG